MTKARHVVRSVGRPKKPKPVKVPKAAPVDNRPELSATALSDGRWAIRPKGQLGTLGLFPKPWDMQVVRAETPELAIEKARSLGGVFHDKSLN